MTAGHAARPRVALIVDNPFRDLPGLVLVAARLARRGALCILVPMNLQGRELWPLIPDFVLLSHLRPTNEDLARDWLAAGIRVGVLDTEGAVFSPVPAAARGESQAGDLPQGATIEEYTLWMPRDGEVRQRVTPYCAWTPGFARSLSEGRWYRREQIVVTGTPRTDFYAEPWRRVAEERARYAEEYPRPLVIINSSFSLSNPRFQTRDEEIETYVRDFGYDRDYMRAWQATQDAALDGMLATANRLAQAFPSATFIWRPHPFENGDLYRERLSRLPNLHVVKRGTVDGWLLRAAALIHWGSSTAIDAGLAGVPAFQPGWLPLHVPVPLAEEASIQPATFDELHEHLQAVLAGCFRWREGDRERIERAVLEANYRADGQAHRRVAEAVLATVEQSSLPTPSATRCMAAAYGAAAKGAPLSHRALGMARQTLGKGVHWSFRQKCDLHPAALPWDSSEKRFTAGEVQSLVAALEQAGGTGTSRLQVAQAGEVGLYRFGYRLGRSVAVWQ